MFILVFIVGGTAIINCILEKSNATLMVPDPTVFFLVDCIEGYNIHEEAYDWDVWLRIKFIRYQVL